MQIEAAQEFSDIMCRITQNLNDILSEYCKAFKLGVKTTMKEIDLKSNSHFLKEIINYGTTGSPYLKFDSFIYTFEDESFALDSIKFLANIPVESIKESFKAPSIDAQKTYESLLKFFIALKRCAEYYLIDYSVKYKFDTPVKLKFLIVDKQFNAIKTTITTAYSPHYSYEDCPNLAVTLSYDDTKEIRLPDYYIGFFNEEITMALKHILERIMHTKEKIHNVIQNAVKNYMFQYL